MSKFLHDANFNPRKKVAFESSLAASLMSIANDITATKTNPVRDVILLVSRRIAPQVISAFGFNRIFRKNIFNAVRSDGGVWFGRAVGDKYTTISGVKAWIVDVLSTNPGKYHIEHHLHLHQLFTEYCALDYGFKSIEAQEVKDFHKTLKPAEMFATRGRMKRSRSSEELALALRNRNKFSPENLLNLQRDVKKRVKTFQDRDWIGLEHPFDKRRGVKSVQTHGSGMQIWRPTGMDARGVSPFIQIARWWLGMPLVGAASGSTADMVSTGLLLGQLKRTDRRYYLLGVLAFVIGGGNHSFHEIASIGRLAGIPYKPGSYSSVFPQRYIRQTKTLHGFQNVLKTGGRLWHSRDLHNKDSSTILNFGRVADVSTALGGKRPKSWMGLADL